MKNRIGDLRRERGYTLKQMGEILNIRDNTLSQYETGKREPQLGMMMSLADFFDVSLEYLMGETDRRDYPLATDDDAIDLLKRLQTKEINYYNVSKETSFELALWATKNQELLNKDYPELLTEAHFFIKQLESDHKSLKWYLDFRKKETEQLDRIIELLELSLDNEFDGASVSQVLEFLEESTRISYDDLEKTLQFMKNCQDDSSDD
ncbi:helix-turn-helix domain-containing protein [Enterococcus sp. DIV1420a]|uniref:helix-turn-helix domain-containing protein n=1 Tax=Enterococcus sp. DIV1420a TaxID=2774672 RepID=UPI003F21ECDB